MTDSRLQGFEYVQSSSQHYMLTDEHNNLLAYRFRLPLNEHPTLLSDLNDSITTLLETIPAARAVGERIRGSFRSAHLGVWADYQRTPSLTTEHRSALKESREFFRKNKALWRFIGSTLRIVSPETYGRLVNLPRPSDPNPDITPDDYPAPYQSVCINNNQQNSVAESTVHQDWQDGILNTVVPFGDFGGAELVLWSCGRIIQTLPGDILIFEGSKLPHQVAEITHGIRHSLDLFTHKSNFDAASRQHIHDGKVHGYREKDGVYRKATSLATSKHTTGKPKTSRKRVTKKRTNKGPTLPRTSNTANVKASNTSVMKALEKQEKST